MIGMMGMKGEKGNPGIEGPEGLPGLPGEPGLAGKRVSLCDAQMRGVVRVADVGVVYLYCCLVYLYDVSLHYLCLISGYVYSESSPY